MNIKKYIKRVFRYISTGLPEQHITAKIVTLSPNDLLKGAEFNLQMQQNSD